MQLGVLQALNPLSNCVTFIAIVPGAYQWKAKCGKNAYSLHDTVENQSLTTYIAISQKWLKIDGYMQQSVRPAFNPLSIHDIYRDCPGRTQGGQNVS